MHRPMYMTVHQRGTDVFSSAMSPSQPGAVNSVSLTSLPSQPRWVHSSPRQKPMPSSDTAVIQTLQPPLKKSLMRSLFFVVHGTVIGKTERQHRRCLVVLHTSGSRRPPDDAEKRHHPAH